MDKGHFDGNMQPGDAILESHITHYMDKVGKILFWVLLFIFFTEIFVCTLVKFGYFSYYLEYQNNVKISFNTFALGVCITTFATWCFFVAYLIIYQKASYRMKKFLVCAILFILTTILSFGHWKYSYLSILYAVPVTFTCPLGKKNQNIMLCLSLVFTIFYSICQYLTFDTKYNFFICVVSILAIVTSYLISSIFYESMMNALSDVEKYSSLNLKLNEEISHDYVTGAFSKFTLVQDLGDKNYFKSIGFIDLDNFKEINDSRGHSVGDHILKNLVRCFAVRQHRIYRYGGDEFVVLSELTVNSLAYEIELIKFAYNNSCKSLFSCDSTFSAGIMYINKNDDIKTILKKCDEVMYIAKHNGKNKISVKK